LGEEEEAKKREKERGEDFCKRRDSRPAVQGCKQFFQKEKN